MEKRTKIYIAGHRGLVGSALLRKLRSEGYTNIVVRTRSELDLTRQIEVENFFKDEKPEYVFLAAAKVGGILANNLYPAEFIYDNIILQANIIHSAYRYGVTKLLYFGSSCIYPKLAPQPMKEEYLLTGKLEPTNEPYAIAKIAGIKMCQSYNRQYGTKFVSVMPTNLYGLNDNFDLETSHVLPALIRKFHDVKKSGHDSVTLWGTGSPRRELLHVDDLADACIFLMRNYEGSEIVNIGSGEDITIRELAELVKHIAGFKGEIVWDRNKPDGSPRKLLDISKLKSLGWMPKISLSDGIKMTYDWYVESTG
ncbi:MAG: GDP-L-fucose synthase [Nitrospirae bacterium]|nr:GDP-L-fucose synthase [Nitrospirota bacterium]